MNNFQKLIVFFLILIPYKCFGEIVGDCKNINDAILCLSNDFSYKYSINIDEIDTKNNFLIKIDDCQFFYEDSFSNKQVCDKYRAKKNQGNIDITPLTKQFFTSIKLDISSGNKYNNFNIINGYSPFVGKFNQKNFYHYWDASKNNFKFERKSIHVVCPVANQQATMSFNYNIKESFNVDIDVRSSNIKLMPVPIFVINKELFIYFNNDDSISIDFPQKLKLKRESIKFTSKYKYSISINKINNNLQLYVDGNVVYNGIDVLERRQWSSFEIRIAAKSSSFYIDKLLIY